VVHGIGPVQPRDEHNWVVYRKVGSRGTCPEDTAAWGVRRGTVVVHHAAETYLSCLQSSMGHLDSVDPPVDRHSVDMIRRVVVGMKVELVQVDYHNTDVSLVHKEVEASIVSVYVVPDLEGGMVAKHKVGPSAEHGDPEVSSTPWVAQRLVYSSWEVYYQDQVERSSLQEAVF